MTTELTHQEVEDRLSRAFQARAEDMAPGDGGEWNAGEAGSVVVPLRDHQAASRRRPRLAVAAVAAGSLALAGVATAAFLATGMDSPEADTAAPRTQVLPATVLAQAVDELQDSYGSDWDLSTPEGVMAAAEKVKEWGYPEQYEAMRDGVVTDDEFQESVDNSIACHEAASIEVIPGGISYSIVVDDEAQMEDAESCHFQYEAYVQTAYFAANPPPDWQESDAPDAPEELLPN